MPARVNAAPGSAPVANVGSGVNSAAQERGAASTHAYVVRLTLESVDEDGEILEFKRLEAAFPDPVNARIAFGDLEPILKKLGEK